MGLISQLEIVLGPLWVWLAGIEHPSAPTIAGGVIVIGAVALTITGGRAAPAIGDGAAARKRDPQAEPAAPVSPCSPEPVP